MKIIRQSAELLTKVNQSEVLKQLELYGRNCYQSTHKITSKSYEGFIELLLKKKHLSVLEHINLSVRLITDRGIMSEITRHRHVSFSIESTRFVKYQNLEFIYPFYQDGMIRENAQDMAIWHKAMLNVEESYKELLNYEKPEIARSVLPNSLSTNIVMTCNLREWLYILNLRKSKGNHPQMVELIQQVYKIFNKVLPVIFNEKTCS